MRLSLLLIFLFIGTDIVVANGKYPIQNFTPSDYKAGNQNIALTQNRGMSVYVANNLGVLSYNGNNWEKHALKTGKKQRSLAFDKDLNRLYLGSQGEFGYFSDQWQYHSLSDSLKSEDKNFDDVWDVYIINSTIYFCTFQKIFVYDGKEVKVIPTDLSFYRSFSANGRLLVQSQSGNLLEVVDNELNSTGYTSKENQRISSIISEDGSYLIFYNSGDIEFSSPHSSISNYASLAKALSGKYVNHVLALSDSRLAISTQTSGLFLYHPKSGRN